MKINLFFVPPPDTISAALKLPKAFKNSKFINYLKKKQTCVFLRNNLKNQPHPSVVRRQNACSQHKNPRDKLRWKEGGRGDE